MILNLGCGNTRFEDCVNIDIDPEVKPDLVCDFTKGLPYESESVDKVYFFHVIEHIEERKHVLILSEIWRVLKPGAKLYIAYPEFTKVARNYMENKLGLRDFWKATIYGRQLSASDFHVALMDTALFKNTLESVGFTSLNIQEEPNEPWNTVICCERGEAPPNYEQLLIQEIYNGGYANR